MVLFVTEVDQGDNYEGILKVENSIQMIDILVT